MSANAGSVVQSNEGRTSDLMGAGGGVVQSAGMNRWGVSGGELLNPPPKATGGGPKATEDAAAIAAAAAEEEEASSTEKDAMWGGVTAAMSPIDWVVIAGLVATSCRQFY